MNKNLSIVDNCQGACWLLGDLNQCNPVLGKLILIIKGNVLKFEQQFSFILYFVIETFI